MNENSDFFWQKTGKIRLSKEESANIFANLQLLMKNGVSISANERLTGAMEPETLFSAAKSIRLSDAERKEMEAEIIRHMAQNPVRSFPGGGDMERGHSQPPKEPFGSRLIFLLRPLTLMTGAMAVFVLCGAGVSGAAESSLPGDFLYPFKVFVNENVRGAFRVTAGSRARFEAERLETRLQEATRLSEEGRLSGETGVRVSGAVNAQMNVLSRAAGDLEANGDADSAAQVRVRAGNVLRRHERVLDTLGETDGVLKADIQNLLNNALKNHDLDALPDAGTQKSSSSMQINATESAVQQMIDAAAKKIENHQNFLPALPPGLRQDAEARLREAIQPAAFSSQPSGAAYVSSFPNQGSGVVSSVSMLPAAGNGSVHGNASADRPSMPKMPDIQLPDVTDIMKDAGAGGS